MNELYTDYEQTENPIYKVIELVAREFNLPYGDNLEIKIKLPKGKIIELSRRTLKEAKKNGMMISLIDEVNHDEQYFTKYTLPLGKIEFIDNGR